MVCKVPRRLPQVVRDSLFRNLVRWRWVRDCGRTSLRLDFPAMQGIYSELCEFEEILLHFKTVKPSFSEGYSTKFPTTRSSELF